MVGWPRMMTVSPDTTYHKHRHEGRTGGLVNILSQRLSFSLEKGKLLLLHDSPTHVARNSQPIEGCQLCCASAYAAVYELPSGCRLIHLKGHQ